MHSNRLPRNLVVVLLAAACCLTFLSGCAFSVGDSIAAGTRSYILSLLEPSTFLELFGIESGTN